MAAPVMKPKYILFPCSRFMGTIFRFLSFWRLTFLFLEFCFPDFPVFFPLCFLRFLRLFFFINMIIYSPWFGIYTACKHCTHTHKMLHVNPTLLSHDSGFKFFWATKISGILCIKMFQWITNFVSSFVNLKEQDVNFA